jgi:hypothetical protein
MQCGNIEHYFRVSFVAISIITHTYHLYIEWCIHKYVQMDSLLGSCLISNVAAGKDASIACCDILIICDIVTRGVALTAITYNYIIVHLYAHSLPCLIRGVALRGTSEHVDGVLLCPPICNVLCSAFIRGDITSGSVVFDGIVLRDRFRSTVLLSVEMKGFY